jgi:hypothetical protein
MHETMRELRVAPLPKAVHWPYPGRAFPHLEKVYAYPGNVQPPESLARQISRSRASTSASFPSDPAPDVRRRCPSGSTNRRSRRPI